MTSLPEVLPSANYHHDGQYECFGCLLTIMVVNMVRMKGLEPLRYEARGLSPLCLPIPPHSLYRLLSQAFRDLGQLFRSQFRELLHESRLENEV